MGAVVILGLDDDLTKACVPVRWRPGTLIRTSTSPPSASPYRSRAPSDQNLMAI